MPDVIIIDVDENNISQYPPKCFLNPKNEGYQIKLDWLKKRFSEGLKIKLLYLETKCIGFNAKVIEFWDRIGKKLGRNDINQSRQCIFQKGGIKK